LKVSIILIINDYVIQIVVSKV